MYARATPPLPWVGYLAEEEGRFVGACAFKLPPSLGEEERVKAQTLPRSNASTRVLEKLEFELSGSVIHPEDGEVWEWHKSATA
jgi:hypothetical protein